MVQVQHRTMLMAMQGKHHRQQSSRYNRDRRREGPDQKAPDCHSRQQCGQHGSLSSEDPPAYFFRATR